MGNENKRLKEENLHLIKHITYGNRDRSIAKCPSRDSIAVSAGARLSNYYNDVCSGSNPFYGGFHAGNTMHPSYGAEAKSSQEEKSDSRSNFARRFELSSRHGIFDRSSP